MSRKVVIRFLLVIAAVAAVTLAAVVPQQQMTHARNVPQLKAVEGITTGLAVEKVAFGAADPIKLRFVLTNTTAQPMSVLKWHTPLEGFDSNMFQVTIDGKKVTYIGRLIKRGAPKPTDYVTVGPGQSVSEMVDLAKGYAIYKAGDYSVTFRSRLFDIGKDAPHMLAAKRTFKPKAIASNAVSFKLTESKEEPTPPAPPLAVEAAAKQPTFKNCSQERIDSLNSALTEAENLCSTAVNDLTNTPEDSRANAERYTTWFGRYNASRYDQVTKNFEKILDALTNQPITLNCGCDEDYFAYVYPNKPYEIYLCNLFWSAPLTGTDSKAGTIIHELSHFTVVAGTDDHVYGQTGCKSLADTDPAKAVENADSHEYFAENNPPLPMPAQDMGLDLLAYALVFILALLAIIRSRQGKMAEEVARE